MVEPKELLTPSMHEKMLETKDKRQKVAMDLQALRASPGWIFLERVLNQHIDNYAEKILNDESLTQDQELALKRERAFFLLFKTLPGGWVEELMQVDTAVSEMQDDPFS